MTRAVAAILGVVALCGAAPAADRALTQTEAARIGFDKAEEAHLAAAAGGAAASLKALAGFYAAHQLWPEALAALARINPQDEDAETLAAEAQYALGRYRQLAAGAPRAEEARGYRAMALVRRGSFTLALAAFASAKAPKGIEADYALARAEALLATGEPDAAAAALARAAEIDEAGNELSRRRFLAAALMRLKGDDAKSRASLRRAAAMAPDDWSMRARLALADDEKALASLSLAWKSEAFDRDLLVRQAALHASSGDVGRALGALASLIARFPESDAATSAQAGGASLLAAIFDDADLSAEDAARLFFEHVSFAPPGREGDALIRRAAARLKTLGLYAQAATLIDHQVFKRLRGGERSRVAAELAELHLAARNPESALAALRSTRIAGLDEETNNRRRRLEAQALARLGKSEAALTLLGGATLTEDRRLRAAIAWDSGDWPLSAADYAAIFSAASGAPSAGDRDAAVRAATAYLLAGDREGYRAFVGAAAPRLQGSREEALIRSLGDIDREAFLDRFMDSYKALYGAPADG